MAIDKLLFLTLFAVSSLSLISCDPQSSEQAESSEGTDDELTDRTRFNPLVPDNIADPSVVMFDDVFYMYATTDIDRGLSEMGPPVVWKSGDFVNWSFDGIIVPQIDWNEPHEFVDDDGNPQTGYFRYWAPGRPLERDGTYYLFPTIVQPDGTMGVYTMVSGHPEGPFDFAEGSGICFDRDCSDETEPLVADIDVEPFINDDGQAYVYWRTRLASKMSDDFQSLEGETIQISTSHGGYSEGPLLFKRNEIYYYVYTLSGHANYSNAYMMSHESPLGPFEAAEGENVFIYTNLETGVWGPGHGNVFHMPGTDDYYFLYLEYGEGSTTRQVFANKMEFTDDGEIETIRPDFEGVGYLGPHQDQEPDLALHATASASSVMDDKTVEAHIIENPNDQESMDVMVDSGIDAERIFTYVPDNAVDGSNRTRWRAEPDDDSPWYMIDLGEVKEISRSEMYFVFPAMGHTWILEKSNDGEEWSSITATNEPAMRSPHVVEEIGSARYLRLNITSGEPGLWRFELF